MGAKGAAAASVEQELVFVGNEEGKITAVRQLLQKGLNDGTLMLGVVKRVTRREIFVALANNLSGRVSIGGCAFLRA